MATEQEKENIPPPPPLPNTGEEQQAASVEIVPPLLKHGETQNGLEQYPSAHAVQMLSETGGFRNPGAKVLLQTLCQLRETDLKDARIERKQTQDELNKIREKYHSEHTQRLVLEERLRNEVPLKHLQNIFITLGGILTGCGLQPLILAFTLPYFILLLTGVGLLIVGLFYPGYLRKQQS